MASHVIRLMFLLITAQVVLSGIQHFTSEDTHEISSGLRIGKQSNLRHAEKCGYYGLKNGQVITIQSSNFNKPTANYEQCSWRILGHRCTLKTSCPCVDVPYDGECTADYLKMSDTSSFSHTFCGDSQPSGIYNSTSSVLTFSYRSDGRDVSNGFVCYVSCTGKGQRDPSALRTNGATCKI